MGKGKGRGGKGREEGGTGEGKGGGVCVIGVGGIDAPDRQEPTGTGKTT